MCRQFARKPALSRVATNYRCGPLGATGLNGSQSDDGIWNVGFRYGLILTAPHGPGFLRGRLEYAVDAVPSSWSPRKRTQPMVLA